MKKLQINILAIIACLLWASAFFSGKFCLNNIPPLTLASIRLIIATIMLKTTSAIQVKKKMYQGSSDAWKKYEAYLKPLLKGLNYYKD